MRQVGYLQRLIYVLKIQRKEKQLVKHIAQNEVEEHVGGGH